MVALQVQDVSVHVTALCARRVLANCTFMPGRSGCISIPRAAIFIFLQAALSQASVDKNAKTLLRRQALQNDQVSIISPGGALLQTTDLPFFDMLIVIPTASGERAQRDAIRNSWGKYLDSSGRCEVCGGSKRTVKLLFLTGGGNEEEVAKESANFSDVAILSEMPQRYDLYTNLTAKVGLCISYAVKHFRFGLLLKADTDSFVFMDRLLAVAETNNMFRDGRNDRPDVYAGKFQRGVTPRETPGQKWADLEYRKVTDFDHFPTYAAGAGYLLGPSLCRYIMEQHDVLSFAKTDIRWADEPPVREFANEDVTVGFWLQSVVHNKVNLPVSTLPSGCQDQSVVIDHHISSKLMGLRMDSLHKVQNPCADQFVSTVEASDLQQALIKDSAL